MLPKLHIRWERWKYNKTFEVYVSNLGNVRNKSKASLAPKIDNSGYMRIYVGGSKPKYMLLHRLVMLTWKPTPEAEILTVDHLNHNKRDNSLDNLEWVTLEENQTRAAQDKIYCNEVDSKKTNKNRRYPDAVKVTYLQSGEYITIFKEEANSVYIDTMIRKLCANKPLALKYDFAEKTIKNFLKFKNGTTLLKKCGYQFDSIYYK
jgi:hypothetical protein